MRRHRSLPPRLVVLVLACALAGPSAAQPLQDFLRRSVEDALRNAVRPPPGAPPAAPAPAPPATAPGAPASDASAPPPAAPSAPPPAATASPPPATAPASVARPVPGLRVEGLDAPLADGTRTLDLRAGTPPELAHRDLPPRARIEVANPYVPVDRRFLDRTTAMACHPQGGLVLWASTRRLEPSPRRGPEQPYAENGTGLWRVQADGRVSPMWVPTFRATDDGPRNCGVPAGQARAPERDHVHLAVEPSGAVVVADRRERTLVRLRPDGRVEHLAGGGPDFCDTNPTRRRAAVGWRDGPARDALFSGTPSVAVDPAGAVWVAENGDADGRAPPNCSLRRIDPSGAVETVHGRGACPAPDEVRRLGHRMAGHDAIAIDARGAPLLMGVHRAPREGAGPDVVYTKVHRIDGGRETVLLRVGHGAAFEPAGRLVALAIAPDGTPLAFNAGHYSDAGLVHLDDGPRLRYWWRSAPGMHDPPDDGPRGTARITLAKDVCAGTDGRVYLLTDRAVRRLDPATGAVDTWLH